VGRPFPLTDAVTRDQIPAQGKGRAPRGPRRIPPEALAAGREGCRMTAGFGSGRGGPGRRASRAGPRQGRRGPIATGRSGWGRLTRVAKRIGSESYGHGTVPSRSDCG